MAKKISQLGQLLRTAIASGDKIPILDESAGQTKYVTVADLVGIPDIGWTAAGEAWAYSAWDSTLKRGTITVPSDATTKYSPGMYLKFAQSTGGTKYGRILSVTSTTIVLYLGAQTLNNEAIASPVYSGESAPFGLPPTIRDYHPYRFSVYRNSAFTISNGSYAKVSFDTEEWDNNANFASGSYTCPVDGYYQFNWRVSHNNAGSHRVNTVLVKNGAVLRRGADVTSPFAGSSGSSLVKCAAGDVMDIQAITTTAALSADVSGIDCTFFNGTLVREGAN